MIRKSPMKSPIQKISNAGSKLVTAASSAVQHGTQLTHAVVSKANAKAEEGKTNFDKILGSPSYGEIKMKSPLKNTKNSPPPRKNTVGGGASRRSGVRDRIHMFEATGGGGGYHSNYQHESSPYHRGGRRYSHSRASPQAGVASRRREKKRDSSKKSDSSIGEGGIALQQKPIMEKENASNMSSPSTSYTFASKDGVKKLSPAFRRKKKKKKQQMDNDDISVVNEAEYVTRRMDNRNIAKMKDGADADKADMYERKESKQLQKPSHTNQQQQQKNNIDESDAMDIAELNRAAAMSALASTQKPKHTNQAHCRSTTPVTNSINPTTYRSSHKKRASPKNKEDIEHSLIQSPLRKHIKVVHESASNGTTCAIAKQPFPLMLPEQLPPSSQQQEKKENSGDCHLDLLGAVSGNTPLKCSSRYDNSEDRNVEMIDRKQEDALDLLSSAAFLFKTSRRNLG